MSRQIDWTKPVQTKRGSPVRIVCIDAPTAYDRPVLGFVDKEFSVTRWTTEGMYGNQPCGIDLVNVPTKRSGWMNLYPAAMDMVVGEALWLSKEQANKVARDTRIACIKVEFEEGEGL